MTEADWLKGKDPEAMLATVADALTPRQWRLLACAVARRVWDLLPDGPLRDVIDWAERLPDGDPDPAAVRAWREKVDPVRGAVAAHAAAEMRAVVLEADPDSADVEAGAADLGPAIPSVPLFAAASRYAAGAVVQAETAAGHAAEATALLLAPPGDEAYGQLRSAVIDALVARAAANQSAANARKLKAQGDEFADSFNARKARVDLARAHQIVQRLEEASGGDAEFENQERVRKSVAKYEARLLHDLAGNPFAPPRFAPAWRTSAVVALARGIFEERAFDRLPILADALLEADCDEEAVLRHCRGTEHHQKHFKEPHPHARGCWVVELILNRWAPARPAATPRPRPRRSLLDTEDYLFPPLGEDDDTGYA